MGKLIIPIFALLIVSAGAWLLLTKSDPEERTVLTTPTRADGPASRAPAPAGDDAPAEPARRTPRPVVKNALPRRDPRPAPDAVAATDAANDPAANPALDPQAAAGPGNRVMRQPKAQMVDVQATVRQFYGNLPKDGKVPSLVTLEEVLPREIIDALDASPQAQITMLGPWQIEKIEAFKEVLAFDPRYDTMLGVTWKRPDGTDARDYISLKAPQSLQPSP